jgi:hypothetical protein
MMSRIQDAVILAKELVAGILGNLAELLVTYRIVPWTSVMATIADWSSA